MRNLRFLLVFPFLFLSSVFAYPADFKKQNIVRETLDKFELSSQNRLRSKKKKPTYPKSLTTDYFSKRKEEIKKTLRKIEIEIALGMGYLSGESSYEIKFPVNLPPFTTGKSRLDFPLGNWLVGVKTSIGYSPLYLNFEGWTQIQKTTSGEMADKDWIDCLLFSSTKSDAELKLKILDINLLYYFLEGAKLWKDWPASRRGKAGFLVGYKFEDFDFDIYGVRDEIGGGSYYTGQKVLEYEVNYQIPYFGLSGYFIDITEPIFFIDRWGIGIKLCYSPYVRGEDEDDHVLRNKIMRGRTKGDGWLAGVNAFLETKNNWNLRGGFDWMFIKTRGSQEQYWYGDDPATPGVDDTGRRITGIDLEIKSWQLFWWWCVEYKF